jgi:DNA-binding HxlR family transcriptional regulator
MNRPGCPLESLLEILEGKWTLLLLHHLFNGVKRFGELRRALHPISPKTLTDRLRLLEERDIVTRTIYSEVPLHVEYHLTERGRRLKPVFIAMGIWVQPEDSGQKNEADFSLQRQG